MSQPGEYFERSESWAVDRIDGEARRRRLAWRIAALASAVALLEALALAMLAPLKRVETVTLLVDRQTGYVTTVDPTKPRQLRGDDALTDAFLAQYVTAREGFDRATVAADYRRVALWSSGPARSSYFALMPATNPSSPLRLYSTGTVNIVTIKSVSRLSPGNALVRFDTQVQDRSGTLSQPSAWIAVVRYRFVNVRMRMEDRLVNPLGFQVTSYRRSAEAPPAPNVLAPGPFPSPIAVDPVVASPRSSPRQPPSNSGATAPQGTP